MLLDGLRERFVDAFSVRYFGVSGSWCCGFCSLKSFWPRLVEGKPLHDTMKRCESYAQVVMKSLRYRLRPGDIVVMSNFDFWSPHGLEPELQALGTRIEELHNIVHSQGAILVLVGPSPKLKREAWKCVPAEVCDVSPKRQAMKNLYARLENTMDGILFLDIEKLLCDGDHCGVAIPGNTVSAYQDQHHLSRVGSQYLAQFLCSDLSKAGWLAKGLK
jgi:hypothetical protein